MRALINALIIFGIAIFGIVMLYINVAHKASVRYQTQEGVFVDVARMEKMESRLRVPLDMERSRALEESLYFLGSFGGWYNPQNVPNMTNPFSVIFPEPLVYFWREYDKLYVPKEENITTSFSTFYGGYFNYKSVREYDPGRWYTLYKAMYPVRPEQIVLYERFELGRDIPETRIYLVGSPIKVESSVGMSSGVFEFYPLITGRSRAPLYRTYQYANKSVQKEFQEKNLTDLFRNYLNKEGLLKIYSLMISYMDGDNYYRLPKYDYKTAVIVYFGKALCLEGVYGFNSTEFCDPQAWLESINCVNNTPIGEKIYWCSDNLGIVNGEERAFHKNKDCNISRCEGAFWKVMKYIYYMMAKESGREASMDWENVDLRIIPFELQSEVKVYEDIK